MNNRKSQAKVSFRKIIASSRFLVIRNKRSLDSTGFSQATNKSTKMWNLFYLWVQRLPRTGHYKSFIQSKDFPKLPQIVKWVGVRVGSSHLEWPLKCYHLASCYLIFHTHTWLASSHNHRQQINNFWSHLLKTQGRNGFRPESTS